MNGMAHVDREADSLPSFAVFVPMCDNVTDEVVAVSGFESIPPPGRDQSRRLQERNCSFRASHIGRPTRRVFNCRALTWMHQLWCHTWLIGRTFCGLSRILCG